MRETITTEEMAPPLSEEIEQLTHCLIDDPDLDKSVYDMCYICMIECLHYQEEQIPD